MRLMRRVREDAKLEEFRFSSGAAMTTTTRFYRSFSAVRAKRWLHLTGILATRRELSAAIMFDCSAAYHSGALTQHPTDVRYSRRQQKGYSRRRGKNQMKFPIDLSAFFRCLSTSSAKEENDLSGKRSTRLALYIHLKCQVYISSV